MNLKACFLEQKEGARDQQLQARMEMMVGYVLQAGVVVSALLLAAGLIWRFMATGRLGFDFTLSGMNLYEFLVHDVHTAFSGAARPRLLISLGILVLLITPYVRVLSSMVYFAVVERNCKYTFFTGFVFAVLTYSLFLR
ncbi:MAG: DUF1634 domain-containing protein [Acidobacteriota bacterium]